MSNDFNKKGANTVKGSPQVYGGNYIAIATQDGHFGNIYSTLAHVYASNCTAWHVNPCAFRAAARSMPKL